MKVRNNNEASKTKNTMKHFSTLNNQNMNLNTKQKFTNTPTTTQAPSHRTPSHHTYLVEH